MKNACCCENCQGNKESSTIQSHCRSLIQGGEDMSIDVTDATFDEVVLQSALPVLVKFSASWCGPCRAIAPAIEELAKELDGQAIIAGVDVDQSPGLPAKYGIRAVPTFILFKGGEVVEQIAGVVPKSALKDMILKAS